MMTRFDRSGLASVPMLALLLLGGCQTITDVVAAPLRDAEVVRLNGEIAGEASGFYAGLRGKTAPACDYDSNRASYAALRDKAQALQQHVAATPGDRALADATTGLGKTIASAELSHQRASAVTTDPSGACMAPGAIGLNADAVARAAKSIDDLQTARSN